MRQASKREELLTGAFCQALIVKKEVSPERFNIPEMKSEQIQCPDDCHLCCKIGVTLDLTAVEALVIYLLNRELVDLIEEYTNSHDLSGYCPFMVMDKCVINTYKPSACQMYMPFEYEGAPLCFYTASDDLVLSAGSLGYSYMNSNAYGIHGFMAMMQGDSDTHLSPPFFRHIYEGTIWWKKNYHRLPAVTRMCLESILDEEDIGLKIRADFKVGKALLNGRNKYSDMLANKPVP